MLRTASEGSSGLSSLTVTTVGRSAARMILQLAAPAMLAVGDLPTESGFSQCTLS